MALEILQAAFVEAWHAGLSVEAKAVSEAQTGYSAVVVTLRGVTLDEGQMMRIASSGKGGAEVPEGDCQ